MNGKYNTKIIRYWTDEQKVHIWTEIELLNLSLYASEHAEAARKIFNDDFSWRQMATEVQLGEKEIGHEVEACIGYLNRCYKTGLWHKGLTSSDLVECSTAWAINHSIEDIRHQFGNLQDRLKQMAIDHAYIVDIAYTHGQPAEPITWGYRFALWMNMLQTPNLNVRMPGKISGATGTGATVHPDLSLKVMHGLDTLIYNASTQIVPRSIMAFCLNSMSEMASVVSKIANDLRVLYTLKEINFTKMPVGSSAMPHKVNPTEAERIIGLSQLVMALVDCVNRVNSTGWLERDLIHSSVERESLPTIFNHVYYCMEKLDDLLSRLQVTKDNPDSATIQNAMSSINLTDLLQHDIDRSVARAKAKELTDFKNLDRIQKAAHDRMWQIIKGEVKL